LTKSTCEVCHRKMDGTGCKGHFVINGEKFSRIPFGYNGEYADEPCPDCGVLEGKKHHWNCDNEICPNCRGQALGCDCKTFELIVKEVVKIES